MGLVLAQLLSECRKIAGVDVDDSGCDDISVTLQMNRAFWETMNKFKFKENQRSAIFTTIIGQNNYQLPVEFEAIRTISIEDPATLIWQPIDYFDPQAFDDRENSNTSSRGIPIKYLRENSSILFQPIPDKVYNIKIRHLLRLQDLSTSNNAIVIPEEWHEIIMYGGTYRLLFALGDINRGDYFKNHTYTMMGSTIPVESKEQIDTKNAGVSLSKARGGYMANYSTRLRYNGGLDPSNIHWNGRINN